MSNVSPNSEDTVSSASPKKLFAAALELAEQNQLWKASDMLMSGFAELGDRADEPDRDSLGRPIRGSAPKLMDKAADWLDLLDNIEGNGVESPAGTPPRDLRWAAWHTISGQGEVRRGNTGRAVDHLELAAGLFEANGLVVQAVALRAQLAQCYLQLEDLPAAEKSLYHARQLTLGDGTIAGVNGAEVPADNDNMRTQAAAEARRRYDAALDKLDADLVRRLRNH